MNVAEKWRAFNRNDKTAADCLGIGRSAGPFGVSLVRNCRIRAALPHPKSAPLDRRTDWDPGSARVPDSCRLGPLLLGGGWPMVAGYASWWDHRLRFATFCIINLREAQ